MSKPSDPKEWTFEEILSEIEAYDGFDTGIRNSGRKLTEAIRYKLNLAIPKDTLLAIEKEIDKNVDELLVLNNQHEELRSLINKKQELVNSLRKAQIILIGKDDA